MIRQVPYFILITLLICCDDPGSPDEPANVTHEVTRGVPLDIDSAFIVTTEGHDTLDFHQIRILQQGTIPEVTNSRSLSGVLNEFCTVDSLKRTGKYHIFADSLQTGASSDAFAQTLGTITMGNGSSVELWKLAFWSYNPSSVFSGTFVIGSIRFGEQLTHIPLGEIFSSIDPPQAVTEMITSRITDDLISLTAITAVDDNISEPGEKVQQSCFNVSIEGGNDLQTDTDFTVKKNQ